MKASAYDCAHLTYYTCRTREDAENAIQQVNGNFVGHRRVRCGWAQHKADANASDITSVDRADPGNANVYVGNIAAEVCDAELRHQFQQFGNVIEVKAYRKGSYGFVQFEVSCCLQDVMTDCQCYQGVWGISALLVNVTWLHVCSNLR